MDKKSFFHAVLASGYICAIVLSIQWISTFARDTPDNFLMPIAMLSLLTLSVAIMGYLFFYHPILLLLENKRVEAVRLFAKTVGIFAAITVVFGAIALYLIP